MNSIEPLKITALEHYFRSGIDGARDLMRIMPLCSFVDLEDRSNVKSIKNMAMTALEFGLDSVHLQLDEYCLRKAFAFVDLLLTGQELSERERSAYIAGTCLAYIGALKRTLNTGNAVLDHLRAYDADFLKKKTALMPFVRFSVAMALDVCDVKKLDNGKLDAALLVEYGVDAKSFFHKILSK